MPSLDFGEGICFCGVKFLFLDFFIFLLVYNFCSSVNVFLEFVVLYHVSRRTDIPGCYWEWFLRRIDEGYVMVRNPHYPEKVSRYTLTPDVCDGFCFLSKNYGPALAGIEGLMSLDELVETYRVCTFDATVTPYRRLEMGLPPCVDRINSVVELSRRYGRERVRWFLAPLLVVDHMYGVSYTLGTLDWLVPRMAEACDSCMPDEINVYDRVAQRSGRVRRFSESERAEVYGHLGDLCREYGIRLQRCPASARAYEQFGVEGIPCLSRDALAERCGVKVVRGTCERCGCVSMRDLGAYAPCPHACEYCYAQPGKPVNYDPFSSMLCDKLRGDEILFDPKQVSLCA